MFGWFRKKTVVPVCGMQMDPKKAAATSEYKGKTRCWLQGDV